MIQTSFRAHPASPWARGAGRKGWGRAGDSVEGPDPHKHSSWVGQTLQGTSPGVCPVSPALTGCSGAAHGTDRAALPVQEQIPPLCRVPGDAKDSCKVCLSVLEKPFCHCQAAKCGKKPLSPTCSITSSEEGDENRAQMKPLGEIKLLVITWIGIWPQN